MKKDIKSFVEENKDKIVFAISYDKDKKPGKKFDCLIQEQAIAEDIDDLRENLHSAINVLEALKNLQTEEYQKQRK